MKFSVTLLLLVLCCFSFSACSGRGPIGFIQGLWERSEPMVLIPAGEFQLGGDSGEANEMPVHTVYVDAFYIDAYPVTNADYKKFVDANPEWQKHRIPEKYHDGNYLALWNRNDYPSDEAEHPVVYVSWYAAMAYAQWAGKRLPTEVEWEKAARGGLVGKKYPWGDTEDISKAFTQMWEQPPETVPVGQYPPNDYGLYDMTGSVWQWCLDPYNIFFSVESSEATAPLNRETDIRLVLANFEDIETPRVLRGGAWTGDPRVVTIAVRDRENPARTLSLTGFRCVRDASP